MFGLKFYLDIEHFEFFIQLTIAFFSSLGAFPELKKHIFQCYVVFLIILFVSYITPF